MNPKYNGIVSIDATVDLNGLGTTAVKLFDLPEKFVAVGMTVEQLEKASGEVALTVESKIGTASAVTFGSTYTVSNTDTLTAPAYKAAKETTEGSTTVPAFVLLDGAQIQIKAASSLTEGKVGVTVYGFADRFAAYTSAGNNKAPVDPYTPPEKK